MNRIKSFGWRVLWAVFAMLSLSGCGALGGLGQGLSNAFRFKLR